LGKDTLLVKTMGLCLVVLIVFLLCTACNDDSNTTTSTAPSATQSPSKFKTLALEYKDSFYQFLDGMDFSDMEQCLKRFRNEEGVALRQRLTYNVEQMQHEFISEKVSVEQRTVRRTFLRYVNQNLRIIQNIDETTASFSFPLNKKEIEDT